MITPEYIVGILQTHSWEGQEIVKLIRKYGEQEVANFISSKQDVIKSVCSFYMAGMDTSGRCNNCGKNKWEH